MPYGLMNRLDVSFDEAIFRVIEPLQIQIFGVLDDINVSSPLKT